MKKRLKDVLAFVNNKGGVAKTTTVQNTAAGMLLLDPSLRILCIDLDPQGNLSSLLGWSGKRKVIPASAAFTVAEALRDGYSNNLPVYKSRENLFYCPASPWLANIEPDLHRQMNSKMVLATILNNDLAYIEQQNNIEGDYTEQLTTISESFDYVLIDCAPALSELTYNALGAASAVIIPMSGDSLSMAGLPPMAKACRMVQQHLNPKMRMRGILMTKADVRTAIAKAVEDNVRETYDEVFNTHIRECVKIKYSQSYQQDIFAFAPACTAAEDYLAFVKELLNYKD